MGRRGYATVKTIVFSTSTAQALLEVVWTDSYATVICMVLQQKVRGDTTVSRRSANPCTHAWCSLLLHMGSSTDPITLDTTLPCYIWYNEMYLYMDVAQARAVLTRKPPPSSSSPLRVRMGKDMRRLVYTIQQSRWHTRYILLQRFVLPTVANVNTMPSENHCRHVTLMIVRCGHCGGSPAAIQRV